MIVERVSPECFHCIPICDDAIHNGVRLRDGFLLGFGRTARVDAE